MFSVGAFFDCLAFFWTIFAETEGFTFKMTFGVLITSQVFCCLLIEWTLKSRFLFGIQIIVANFTVAGVYGLTPNLIKKIFGEATAA